jgi:hypothetical protein
MSTKAELKGRALHALARLVHWFDEEVAVLPDGPQRQRARRRTDSAAVWCLESLAAWMEKAGRLDDDDDDEEEGEGRS